MDHTMHTTTTPSTEGRRTDLRLVDGAIQRHPAGRHRHVPDLERVAAAVGVLTHHGRAVR